MEIVFWLRHTLLLFLREVNTIFFLTFTVLELTHIAKNRQVQHMGVLQVILQALAECNAIDLLAFLLARKCCRCQHNVPRTFFH